MNTSGGRIVVGVDGSSASMDAVRWAVAQAELTGCDVQAITSWQNPAQYGADIYTERVDWDSIARMTLDNALKEVGEGSPLAVTKTTLEGHPAKVLCEASVGATLVVVGSRGHGGFVGMLLGSVSEYVIAHAKCPVLVVRHLEA